MYKRITFFSIPSFLFWCFKAPTLFFHWLWYKYRKKDFNEYIEILHTVNELRKVCYAHGDKDKNGNWNVKCFYKFNGRSIVVKIRFSKKAGNTVYDKFKQDIEFYTKNTSNYTHKKGFMYFTIVFDFPPLLDIEADRKSVSVGTSSQGLYMWDYWANPHALITADTRQGKSTCMYYLISGLLKANIPIRLVDGKKIDFNDCKNLFYDYISYDDDNYEEILDFIIEFKNSMFKRLEDMRAENVKNYMQSKDLMPHFLIIDEYLVIADNLDKKQKEILKKEIGTIIRFGGAAGYILAITMQRADSEFISTSIRDNFKLKAVLGGASSTSYEMMFEDSSFEGFERGKGWFKQGNQIDVVHIPLFECVQYEKKENQQEKNNA